MYSLLHMMDPKPRVVGVGILLMGSFEICWHAMYFALLSISQLSFSRIVNLRPVVSW